MALASTSTILPFSGTVTDYQLPTFSRLNVRPAVHSSYDERLEKFNTAITKMKELPYDDPRNFYQQANIYANGYRDYHGSWLHIIAFHRWYLYFIERMLQAVAGDASVAVPYWASPLDTCLPYPTDWVLFPDMDSGMGNLSSDVDRWWTVWRTLGGKRTNITNPEWLQKTFLFYDENKNLVRVKVEDCLDNEKLGYTYQDMPNSRRKNFEPLLPFQQTRKNLSSIESSLPAAIAIFPATLDKSVTFYATRPETSMKKKDKEELLNLLVEYDETKNIRFDAYLNENGGVNLLEIDMAEYAGSFINFAQSHNGSGEQTKMTTWSPAIAELLEDLALGGEKKIPVTLVPKCGGEVVTVKSADITTVAG